MTVVIEKRRRTRIVFLFIFDFSVEIDRNERSCDVEVEERSSGSRFSSERLNVWSGAQIFHAFFRHVLSDFMFLFTLSL